MVVDGVVAGWVVELWVVDAVVVAVVLELESVVVGVVVLLGAFG